MPDSMTTTITAENVPVDFAPALNRSGLSIQLSGNFNATVGFYGTTNGSTFEKLQLVNVWTGEVADHASAHSIWEGSCTGLQRIRLVAFPFVAGPITVTITVNATIGRTPSSLVSIANLAVDTHRQPVVSVACDPLVTVSDIQFVAGTAGVDSPVFVQAPLTNNELTAITVTNLGTVPGTVALIDSYTGNAVWQLPCPVADGHSITFSPPLRQWAGDGGLKYVCSDETMTAIVCVHGYRKELAP